jgi:hypothetical protein
MQMSTFTPTLADLPTMQDFFAAVPGRRDANAPTPYAQLVAKQTAKYAAERLTYDDLTVTARYSIEDGAGVIQAVQIVPGGAWVEPGAYFNDELIECWRAQLQSILDDEAERDADYAATDVDLRSWAAKGM